MTVTDRIVKYLGEVGQDGATNSQIAQSLNIPEPSVRRTALQLERAGRVTNVADSITRYLKWALTASEVAKLTPASV